MNESLFGLLDVRYRSLIGLSGMDLRRDVRVGSCRVSRSRQKAKSCVAPAQSALVMGVTPLAFVPLC